MFPLTRRMLAEGTQSCRSGCRNPELKQTSKGLTYSWCAGAHSTVVQSCMEDLRNNSRLADQLINSIDFATLIGAAH